MLLGEFGEFLIKYFHGLFLGVDRWSVRDLLEIVRDEREEIDRFD